MNQLSNEDKERLEKRISELIEELQRIQKTIRSTGQPASMLELGRLKELGSEYSRLIEELGENPR